MLVGATPGRSALPPVELDLDNGQVLGLTLPDAGTGRLWRIRVIGSDPASLVVCLTSR